MPITTVASDGLKVAVTAALPATIDIAGFAALTWVDEDSCAFVDGGSMLDTWTEITDDSMCPEGGGKIKGKRQFGDISQILQYYKGSPTMAVLRTAEESQSDVVSIRVTLSNGDLRYRTVMVAQFGETYGATGGKVQTPLLLWPQSIIVRDGV